MHDGYLFTLGLCGTASASSPAPALLNAMLAALPPVKRAALLGEVLPFDSQGQLLDAMLPAILGDIRDAELLLVVTPLLPGGRLPARLEALLHRASQLLVALPPKYAVLVAVDDAEPALNAADLATGRAQLAQLCQPLQAAPPLLASGSSPELLQATREAYEQASAALGGQHLR
ncbi:MAG: hypothetical protein MUD01_10465 [Chloroflexaceae bacterium]|jgi:hypothetical protein|nr:hypothetical protein [Chloroflexaceae bacterium]